MWLRWLSNKLFCLFQQEYNKSWDDFLKYIAEESNVVGFSEHTVSFKLNNRIYIQFGQKINSILMGICI